MYRISEHTLSALLIFNAAKAAYEVVVVVVFNLVVVRPNSTIEQDNSK